MTEWHGDRFSVDTPWWCSLALPRWGVFVVPAARGGPECHERGRLIALAPWRWLAMLVFEATARVYRWRVSWALTYVVELRPMRVPG
jgi:hypothetical protein